MKIYYYYKAQMMPFLNQYGVSIFDADMDERYSWMMGKDVPTVETLTARLESEGKRFIKLKPIESAFEKYGKFAKGIAYLSNSVSNVVDIDPDVIYKYESWSGSLGMTSEGMLVHVILKNSITLGRYEGVPIKSDGTFTTYLKSDPKERAYVMYCIGLGKGSSGSNYAHSETTHRDGKTFNTWLAENGLTMDDVECVFGLHKSLNKWS